MGQKDSSEKLLEDYTDVFADIVNVLLFHGKEIVKEEDLLETGLTSQYKADDGKLHEQERDVGKYWKGGNVKIALFGLENQTREDRDMPLRVINYDGASYRSELLKKDNKERYPVVSIVLYYGIKRWEAPCTLYEALKIPDELKPYVNDYKINLVEVAFLPDEVVKMFKSDFRIVADFFTKWRKTKEYIPEKKEIKHVDELMKFFDVFSAENRFYETVQELRKEGKEVTQMCDVVDKIEARGEARGKAIGEEKLSKLISILLKNNLTRDISLATESETERERLYRKYGITD